MLNGWNKYTTCKLFIQAEIKWKGKVIKSGILINKY